MKSLFIFTIYFAVSGFSLFANNLSQGAHFDSVDGFVQKLKAFQPTKSKSDLTTLFTVKALGQPEDPQTGKPVAAQGIDSVEVLWSDDSAAFVFAKASPKTEATRSVVGVLFFLKKEDHHWRIADHQRFTAFGKYSDIIPKQDASVGTGSHLSLGWMRPMISVKEWQGGRGYGYAICATYTVKANRIQQVTMENQQ